MTNAATTSFNIVSINTNLAVIQITRPDAIRPTLTYGVTRDEEGKWWWDYVDGLGRTHTTRCADPEACAVSILVHLRKNPHV